MAIVFSAQAMSANGANDFAKAHEAAEKASKFIMYGVIGGVVSIILNIILQVFVLSAAG